MVKLKHVLFLTIFASCALLLTSQLVHADGAFGTLVIEWAGTIDNGEGDGWPHGPYGNFRYLIFEPGDDVPQGGFNIYDYGGNGPQLAGDTWTDSKYEWTDGGQKSYSPEKAVHQWRHENDSIVLFIYESDSDCITLPFWGKICSQRDEDPVFSAQIHRQDLETGGIMVVSPFTAAQDAINNAESRTEFHAWFNRADVITALNEARDSGLIPSGSLPKTFVQLSNQ